MPLSCYVPSQIIPKSRVVHLADKQILKRHILSYSKIIVSKNPRGAIPGPWTNSSYKSESASRPIPFVTLIIMCIYHALINAFSSQMIHINLTVIFCTHVEHSPTKTIYIKYYTKKNTKKPPPPHTHTDCSRNWVLVLGLRSCGTEFQLWGPKQEKVRTKPMSLAFALLDFQCAGVRKRE